MQRLTGPLWVLAILNSSTWSKWVKPGTQPADLGSKIPPTGILNYIWQTDAYFMPPSTMLPRVTKLYNKLFQIATFLSPH